MSDERAANDLDRAIGLRVRTRRAEVGLSQERLADLIGVTFQQVQKYEKGVNRIAAGRLLEIAAALETPVAAFFEGLGPCAGERNNPRSDAGIAAAMRLAGATDLLVAYATLSTAARRRAAVRLVRALGEEEV